MALGWPGLILLLFACKYASTYTLSPDVTAFVPECAQACFKSFIASNFGSFPDVEVCGDAPSLSCLCTHNSTSGYTIGEGAVQCLISEDNIGFCQGENATNTVVAKAYTMCSGVQDALPETHGTITATLVVQTSSPSIVLVASPATLSSSRTSSSLQTTPSMTTLPPASAVRTTPASSTATAQAATTTPSVTGVALSKSLIAGISVAAVAGTAVIVGLIICLVCWRRRKQKRARRDSDSMPFQNEPPAHLMEKKSVYNPRPRNWKPVVVGPGPTPSGIAVKMSPEMSRSPPPVPARVEGSDPLMFSRRSIRPDAIGIAISPDSKGTMAADRRRASRLLPEKPTLKLRTPSQGTVGQALSFPIPLGAGRESIATQFEEDIDTAETAVNSDDAWAASSLDGGAKPSNYTKDGQWSENDLERPLRQQNPAKRQSGLRVEPLSIARMQDGNNPSQPRGGPLMPSLMPAPHPSPAASSNYSDHRSNISNGIGRSNTMSSQRSYRQAGPYDTEPIEFVVSPDDYEEPQPTGRTGGTTDLSPVMESPASGKSPVSYPKIPKAISPTISRVNYGPPPPKPDFTRGMRTPPSQSQQPWRAAEIQAQQNRARIAKQKADAQSQAQIRAPPRAASANDTRRRSRDKVGIVELPANPRPVRRRPDQSQLPPSLKINTQDGPIVSPPRSKTAPLTDATGGWDYNPYVSLYAQSQSQPEPQNQNQNQRPQPRPYQVQNLRREASPNVQSTATSSSNTIPTSQNPLMSPVWQPQPQPQPKVQQQNETQPQLQPPSQFPTQPLTRSASALSTHSQMSQASKHSTSSSLLAKRLGETKASKLALKTNDMNEGRKRQQAKWRVLDREAQERAREENWKPMLGSGKSLDGRFPRNGDGMGDGNGNGDGGARVQYAEMGKGKGREFERMDLPSTPGWVPKLTPTRRGDVLFLNVQ